MAIKKPSKSNSTSRPTTRTRTRGVKSAKKTQARKKVIRALVYDKDLAFEILDYMEENASSLRQALLSDKRYPTRRTFYRWRKNHPELEEEYLLVCEVRDDNDFDEINEIAESASEDNFQIARLTIDTRKWSLGKRQPTKFGTKKVEADVKHSGEVNISMVNYDDSTDDTL